MAINRGMFVRQVGAGPTAVGTTPKEARLALAGLLAENAPGVPRPGLLYQSAAAVVTGASGMTYNVGPCNPVIPRVAAEGVYLPTFTNTTAVPTTAAPGTGFRYDLIWVKQNDPEKAEPNNDALLGVTQGLASSSPTRPTADVPAGALILSEALVAANATATNGPDVTITQLWRHTVARGAAIPVRDVTERDEITAHNGLQVVRLDKGGRVDTYAGDTWGTKEHLVSLGAGWVNQAGSVPARVEVRDGMAALNGLVRRDSGTFTTVGTIPLEARPDTDVSFTVLGQNAANAAGPLARIYVAAATGVVTVNVYTGLGGAWTTGATGTWFPFSAAWAVAS